MKEYTTTKRIAMLALFTALIAVATAVISIPGPIGYTNFGDAFIYIGAALFGPVFGMITGGLGRYDGRPFSRPAIRAVYPDHQGTGRIFMRFSLSPFDQAESEPVFSPS